MMKTREIQFTTLNQEQKLEGGEDQKDKEQPVRHSKEEKKTKCKKETNMIHRGNIRQKIENDKASCTTAKEGKKKREKKNWAEKDYELRGNVTKLLL